MKRTINFGAGPATMPLPALEAAKDELLDFAGTGMSILEVSHRSPEYDKVHNEVVADMKELLGIGDNYKVLFMGGGASTQFAMIPLNFLSEGKTADYLVTGTWSKKAIKEAKIVGQAAAAADTEVDGKFTRIPKPEECKFTDGAAYVHLTSNNTIFGTQWHDFPQVKAPLIADMSSDLLWRKFDASQFSMIYAGAQKNLGPAGVTVVCIREDLLAQAKPGLLSMLSYQTYAGKNSLYNTPPCFPIYMVGKTLKWIKGQGGVEAVEKVNREKGKLLYSTIDANPDFFRAPVEKDSRSLMNVVFRLPTEELEQQFIAQGKEQGIAGLKGHRSVGGIRVSMYNAAGLDWIQSMVQFMGEFIKKNG